MCESVIGYQFASPDAFRHIDENNSIDLDGINITHGTDYSHIWSYVAGYNIKPITASQHLSKYPCSNDDRQGIDPPSLIGDNYYCESGNPNNNHTETLYTDDPLWDGQQCEGTCCTGINYPPWFSNVMELVETQLITAQSNMSQNINTKLSLLTQYLSVQTKINCGLDSSSLT